MATVIAVRAGATCKVLVKPRTVVIVYEGEQQRPRCRRARFDPQQLAYLCRPDQLATSEVKVPMN
jgi:hypothetical protein